MSSEESSNEEASDPCQGLGFQGQALLLAPPLHPLIMRPMLQVRLLQQRLRTLSCQLAATKAAATDAVVDIVPGELDTLATNCCTYHDPPCMQALPNAAKM